MSSEQYIKCPSCGSKVLIGYKICPYCGFDLRPLIRRKASAELTFRDIIRRIEYVSIKPSSVFREIILAPEYSGPFLIVIAGALLLALRFLIVLLSAIPNIQLDLMSGLAIFLIAFISSSLMFIFIWYLLSLLLHAIIRLIGGIGSFSLTLVIVGYSLTPLILGFFISNNLLFFVPNLTGTSLIDYLDVALNSSPVVISSYIFTGMLLWFGYLLSLGFSYAHGINKIASTILAFSTVGALLLIFNF
ncbi:MAG: YIP1 family protein [Candidatus Njordarchaeia archaeon]|nr:YIP1 family protein [Candidatus Korarchaeota archaeon]